MEAGDDFRLALGHVERRAVGFGHARDEVDDEQGEQREKEEFEKSIITGLRVDDAAEVHGAGGDQHADQGKTHGDFVADDLRGRTQRAQDGVLGVGRPAGQDDAVHAHRRQREQDQQSGVDVGQHHGIVKRDDRPRGKCRCQRQDRREFVQEWTGVGRNDQFLEQHLEHVGEGLDPADAEDAADELGSVAYVHPTNDLALGQHVEGHRDDHRQRDGEDLDHRPDQQADRAELQEEVAHEVEHAQAPVTVSAAVGDNGDVAS